MRPIFTLLCLLPLPVDAQIVFERELDLPMGYESGRITRLTTVDAGAVETLCDIAGSGAITHIWMTVGQHEPRSLVIRMYWDGESDPSVEAPVAAFFGVGHNRLQPEEYFATPALTVGPNNGFNLYLPMPFRERARITVTNDGDEPISEGGGVYFQADYVNYDELAESTPYFHAQWRRESIAQRRGRPYIFAQAVGSGFLAGVTLHVHEIDWSDRWYHGGGDYLFLDAPSNPVVIKGIGGEDFVGESWGSKNFVSPYAGVTSSRNRRHSFYRFFLESPPRFSDSAQFALGAMANEITSVAYWYQTEPHARFTLLPPLALRRPGTDLPRGEYDTDIAPGREIPAAIVGPFLGDISTPIPLDGLQDVDVTRGLLTNYLLPFKDLVPDEQNRRVQWQRYDTTLNWLDLEAVYKPKMAGIRSVQAMPNAICYVYLRVNADRNRDTVWIVGHDDPLRLWLNGKIVADWPEHAGFAARSLKLDLQQGTNELLFKVTNTWNDNWAAFALSLVVNDREGLSFHEFQDLSEALPK